MNATLLAEKKGVKVMEENQLRVFVVLILEWMKLIQVVFAVHAKDALPPSLSFTFLSSSFVIISWRTYIPIYTFNFFESITCILIVMIWGIRKMFAWKPRWSVHEMLSFKLKIVLRNTQACKISEFWSMHGYRVLFLLTIFVMSSFFYWKLATGSVHISSFN